MSIIDRAIYGKNTPSNVLRQTAGDIKYAGVQSLKDAVFGVQRKNRSTNENGAFSPDKFRSSFANGIASNAYFQFRLARVPKFMEGKVNADVLRTIPMRVQKAAIPDMAIQTNPVTFGGGLPILYPYENSTSPLTLDILSSSNLWEREFFTAWQNYIIDYNTTDKNPTFNIAYYDDYVADAYVDYYNEEGERTTIFKFQDIYPKTLTQVDLDWSSTDAVMTFSVELSYSYWGIDYSTAGISQTVYEKTSVLSGILDALKTMGIDKIDKSIDKSISNIFK